MNGRLSLGRSRLILVVSSCNDSWVKGVGACDRVEARIVEEVEDLEVFELALGGVVGGDRVEDGAGTLRGHEVEFVGRSEEI